MAKAFISMIGFKATKDLLAFGLSEAEYIDLQEKVLSIKNSAKTSYWSAEEITFLKENYSSKGQRYCADNLGRSLGAISSKASELELKIGRFFSEEELNFLKNKAIIFIQMFFAIVTIIKLKLLLYCLDIKLK